MELKEWLLTPLLNWKFNIQVELEFGNVGFCGGRKTRVPGEKPSEQGREPPQTQPTYDAETGNQIQATLVGGECSHHCAIPAPLLPFKFLNFINHSESRNIAQLYTRTSKCACKCNTDILYLIFQRVLCVNQHITGDSFLVIPHMEQQDAA